jgi:putative membrane protein
LRAAPDMSPSLKVFLQRWVINTVAVMVAANVVPGIAYGGLTALLVASLLLGILNVILRPLLLLLSLPLVILTLGLFVWVINAVLLYFVGQLVKSFHVADFWSAMWGALIISVVSLVLNSLTGTGEGRIEFRRPKPPGDRPGSGGGPVIDV